MNNESLVNKYQEGIPDAEMPELEEDDFAVAKPNRFTKNMFQLDDDVAAYFKTRQEVNDALRLAIRLSQMILQK